MLAAEFAYQNDPDPDPTIGHREDFTGGRRPYPDIEQNTAAIPVIAENMLSEDPGVPPAVFLPEFTPGRSVPAAETVMIPDADLIVLFDKSVQVGKHGTHDIISHQIDLHRPVLSDFLRNQPASAVNLLIKSPIKDPEIARIAAEKAASLLDSSVGPDFKGAASIGLKLRYDFPDLAEDIYRKATSVARGFPGMDISPIKNLYYMSPCFEQELPSIPAAELRAALADPHTSIDVRNKIYARLCEINDPAGLMISYNDPQTLKKSGLDNAAVYVEKLRRGDYVGWEAGLKLSYGAAEAVLPAAQEGIIDLENPEFRAALDRTGTARYFSVLNRLVKIQPISSGFQESMMDRIRVAAAAAQEDPDAFGLMSGCVEFLCGNSRHTPELRDLLAPLCLQILADEQHAVRDISGSAHDVLSALWPVCLEDFSGLAQLCALANKPTPEVRSAFAGLAWKIFTNQPEKIDEFLHFRQESGFSDLFPVGNMVAQFDISDFDLDEGDPRIRASLARLINNENLEPSSNNIAPLAKIIGTGGFRRLAEKTRPFLDKIKYSVSEIPFVNASMDDVLQGETAKVGRQLNAVRDLKEQCGHENLRKRTKYILGSNEEEEMWRGFYPQLAALIGISEPVMRDTVNRLMEDPKGYEVMREQLPYYAKMARANPALYEQFFKLTGEMPAKDLWEFLVDAFPQDMIGVMTGTDMISANNFLQKTGNLHLGKSYGIYKDLKKGKEQFMEYVNNKIVYFLSDPKASVDPGDPYQMELLRELTRYRDNDNVSHRPFEQVVAEINEARRNGLLELPDGYVPRLIKVKKIDQLSDDGFAFRQEAMNTYHQLQQDLREAITVDKSQLWQDAWLTLAETVDNINTALLGRVREGKQSDEMLIKLEKVKSLGDLLVTGGSAAQMLPIAGQLRSMNAGPQIDHLIRRLALNLYAFSDRDAVGRIEKLENLARAPADAENMNLLVELIEHQVGTEFVKNNPIFNGTRAVFSAKGIRTELARRQEFLGDSGLEDVLILPTRGVLGVLSAAISDACYPQEVSEFVPGTGNPHILPHILVRNPGTKKARVAGAFLVFENLTDSKNSAPYRALAGIDPLTNCLREIKAESLVAEIIAYMKSLPDKTKDGDQVGTAISVEDYLGTSTNRTDINDVLLSMFAGAQDIVLTGPTEFGDLTIKDKCRVVGL